MTIELNPLWAIPVVVAAIAASIAWTRWALRQRRAKTARQMAELGFEPANVSDPGLIQRLKGLQRSGNNYWNVAIAWKRDEPDGRTYVFDLWVDRNDQRVLEGGYVLIISPRLSLPRFGILRKITATGLFTAAASRFRNYVIGHLGPVPFDDYPDFDRRYAVMGEDKDAVRGFLTPARLQELTRLTFSRIEADGDTFSYVSVSHTLRLPEVIAEAGLLRRRFQG